MERKLVMESYLKCKIWKLVEMYILLTDDIVELDMRYVNWTLDVLPKQLTASSDKDRYKQHQDLSLRLLIAKCPVSNITS